MVVNPEFKELKREYIFPIIESKLRDLKATSSVPPINLGIGDVARPLSPVVAQGVIDATLEMTQKIYGYGPHQGYLFLREAIVEGTLSSLGIEADEIFISDGINSDAGGMQDLFAPSATVGILDPTYPAYLDATILAGKKRILFFPCTEENGFCPLPQDVPCDLLYLCSPNNPTGVAMTRKQLQAWVSYALRHEAVILFDHAYQAFVRSSDVPKSIFEIPGAKECAIELHSFSKKAGFTGLRCAYAVIPKTVRGKLGEERVSLHALWDRRQAAKFNGVAYPIQRGALAACSLKGKQETEAQVEGYLTEAGRLKKGLEALGMTCYGGIDSPYIWWKTPGKMSSWEFFDLLLKQCHLISIPGSGFGKSGEGYVRLSAFVLPETTNLALERLQKL